jgi:hypothetical protein
MPPEDEARLHQLTRLIAYEKDTAKLKLLAEELLSLIAKHEPHHPRKKSRIKASKSSELAGKE